MNNEVVLDVVAGGRPEEETVEDTEMEKKVLRGMLILGNGRELQTYPSD